MRRAIIIVGTVALTILCAGTVWTQEPEDYNGTFGNYASTYYPTGTVELTKGTKHFTDNAMNRDIEIAGGAITVADSFNIGTAGIPENTLNMTGGTLTCPQFLNIGLTSDSMPTGAFNVFNISGGTVTADWNIEVGQNWSGRGEFNITGNSKVKINAKNDAENYDGWMYVGRNGIGALTIDGGTLDCLGVCMAQRGTATVNLIRGELKSSGAESGFLQIEANGYGGSRGTVNFIGSEGDWTLEKYVYYPMSVDTTNTNFLAGVSGEFSKTKVNNSVKFYGKVNGGLAAGVAVLDKFDPDSYEYTGGSLLTASVITGGYYSSTDLITLSIKDGNSIAASLNPACKVGESLFNSDLKLSAPANSGWFSISGLPDDQESYSLSLTMNSEDGLDALAAWINEWNTDSDNSSVATANGNALTLANLPLNDITNGLVGWDFTRYNAEYGTSFAVLAARAHEVPEPAAWILLLTGLLFLGGWTRRRLQK